MRAALLLGFAASGVACARGPETRHGADPRVEMAGPVVLELQPERVPLVRATVDGHPDLLFVLDSGAQVTLVDEAGARALGLVVREHAEPWSTKGSDGRSWAIDSYTELGRLELGALALHEVHVQVRDIAANRPDGWFGILGQDVLSRFALLFDMERRQLHVLPPDSTQASITAYIGDEDLGEGEWGLVELQDARTRPSLVMSSNGRDYRLLIDTGADGTSLPRVAIEALGLKPLREYEARTVGGTVKGSIYRLEELDWFGFRVSADVQDTDLEAGLLGMNILREFVFVLDGPGQKLWMHRRTPAAPPK